MSLKMKVQKFWNITTKHFKKSKLRQFLPSVDFGSECMTANQTVRDNLRNDELIDKSIFFVLLKSAPIADPIYVYKNIGVCQYLQ
jgi:hypothetical protein